MQKKGNEYEASIVSYVPSDNFSGVIATTNVRNLQSEKFDGTISSQNWDDEEFKRWYYKDGNVISRAKGKVIPDNQPVKEYLSCRVAYEYVDIYQTIEMGPYRDIRYVETIKVPVIICVEVGTPSGCSSPYCVTSPLNTGGSGGTGNTSPGLLPVDTGRSLTQRHVICPSSLSVTNGVVGLRNFNLALLLPDGAYVSPAGDWRIETNIFRDDPFSNATANLVSETFRRVMLLAASDVTSGARIN